jgi:hypothetical protein
MSVYREFEIETFQLGRDQWHACFRPIDRSKAIVIDGYVTLPEVFRRKARLSAGSRAP